MTSPSPTFSIITPTFNSGDKLLRTSGSLVAQGVDFEHLIIDGVSTDGSAALAQTLAANPASRVRLISEPDKGIYDAMNKGMRHAAGRYVYFLGAGDTLFPGTLAKIAPLLPTHDRGFVYGNVIRGGGRRYDGPFNWRKLCENNICHQAIFYGRDVFKLCGEYDLRYRAWADWEFNFRCFGNRKLAKQYLPVDVSNFEEDGVSAHGDVNFLADFRTLIRRHFGLVIYCRYRLSHAYRRRFGWPARAADPLQIRECDLITF